MRTPGELFNVWLGVCGAQRVVLHKTDQSKLLALSVIAQASSRARKLVRTRPKHSHAMQVLPADSAWQAEARQMLLCQSLFQSLSSLLQSARAYAAVAKTTAAAAAVRAMF